MDKIYELAKKYRNAIEEAKEEGEFIKDVRFCQFPSGCCDDACDLLAQYLLEHGIRTHQVLGAYRDGIFENNTGHAWLIKGKIIIDITGDQFRYDRIFLNFNEPVYVGRENEFYRLFERDRICENIDIKSNVRLYNLYKTISKYID
jgi:hypothetical protein